MQTRRQSFEQNASGTRRGMIWNVQWFQQDVATPHTANITTEWLDYRFPNQLIRRRREPEWSPHLLDVTPSQIFISGCSWRITCMRTIHNQLLNIKRPSIRRFVPYQKRVSWWLTTSLDEFKKIISAMAIIWNTSRKNASFKLVT